MAPLVLQALVLATGSVLKFSVSQFAFVLQCIATYLQTTHKHNYFMIFEIEICITLNQMSFHRKPVDLDTPYNIIGMYI